MPVGAKIDSRYTWLTGTEDEYAVLIPYFRHRVPGYYFMNRYRSGDWDGYHVWLSLRGRVPTGLYLLQKAKIESETDIRFEESFKHSKPIRSHIFGSLALPIEDRPYQQAALKALLGASLCGGLVLSATGTGKTALIGAYFAHIKEPACFIVDELTLLEQARYEISRITGEPVGIVGNSRFEPQRLTCATAQSLQKHRKRPDFKRWFRGLKVLVIDEIHVMLNRRSIQIVRKVRPNIVIGLTATLQLRKAEVRFNAAALAGPVIFEYPLKQGVAEGYLSKGVGCLIDFPEKGEEGATYADNYSFHIVENARRNRLIEEYVREGYRRGRSIVVLIERVRHLKILDRRLRDIPHRAAYGAVDSAERRKIQKEMAEGKVRLTIANRVFGKGINIQIVDCIVDGCASVNPNSSIQRYGRGTRQFEGKLGLIFIDIQDSGKTNPFAKASRSRASALKQAGIPTSRFRSVTPAEVFDRAERLLNQPINRPESPALPPEAKPQDPNPGLPTRRTRRTS